MAVTEYLRELINQKKALANNLVEKGVQASEDEKFNTLVPKVLDVSEGGEDISEELAQQEQLIATLREALKNKSGGGATIEEVDVIPEARAEDVGKIIRLKDNRMLYECIHQKNVYILSAGYTKFEDYISVMTDGYVKANLVFVDNEPNVSDMIPTDLDNGTEWTIYVLNDGTNWFLNVANEKTSVTDVMETSLVGKVDELPVISNDIILTCYLLDRYTYYSYGFDDVLNKNIKGEISISSDTAIITPYHFGICWLLEKVNIPNSVIMIGEGAFGECIQLKIVDLSHHTHIPELGANTFDGCNMLQEIRVPNALLDQFKTAEGWSTYASIIVGV